MDSMKTKPSADEVQAALDGAETAWHDKIILEMRDAIPMDAVKRFMERNPDSRLAELACEIEKLRTEYNQLLKQNALTRQLQADQVSHVFATDLFQASVPGDVTLNRRGRSPVTVHVDGLSTVYDTEHGVQGYVKVSSHGGRCRGSERFYTEHGHIFLADADIY